jgi:CBS domain-containing protein
MSSSPAEAAAAPLTVGDVMRPPTTTVEADAHLAAAAYLMKRSGDGALVVTTDDEDRRPIAVVTDAHISQAVADGRDLDEVRINGLHLPRPETVEPEVPVVDLAQRMLEGTLTHVPVVRGGRLVGLVDLPAVCRELLRMQTG